MFKTFPVTELLVINDNGAVPNKVSLLVNTKPLPLGPAKLNVFIFLLAGIKASSGAGTLAVAGAKKLVV